MATKNNKKRDQELEDMRQALKFAPSRRMLDRILRHSGYFDVPQCDESPLSAAYKNGSRYVGWFIKQEIDKADPGAFPELLKERRKQHE